jgi:hypothetical protein
MNATVHKIVVLVLTLARLHNYCIDENDACCDAAYSTATDKWRNKVSGAFSCLVQTPQLYNNDASSAGITPRQQLDGGNHFDDISANGRNNIHFHANDCTPMLPILV